MDQLKLRTYDGIAITGFMILPAIFSTELSKLAEQNGAAAWIVLLIAFVIMSFLFLITAYLSEKYEGKNIIEITSMVMGKPFGVLYGVILSIYFCFFTGIHIRESSEILKIYGLNLTPIYVIAGLLLLTAVIMNFLGEWSIVKSAGFFFVIVVLGIIFVILLGLNRYNPDNLVPILGNGIPDIAKNSLFMTSLFDSVIILYLFTPSFSKPSKMRKSGMLSLTITTAAYIILYICFIMMFSRSIGSGMMSGFIEMGKSSYYNHFFYRFESILLFFLIFSSAMLASIGILVANKSLSCTFTFKLKSSKWITVVCVIPVLAAMLFPANILDLTQKYLPVIRQYSVFFIAGFPMIVLIISIVKGAFKHEKS